MQAAVFALYVAEEKVEPEVVQKHADLATQWPGASTSRCFCQRGRSGISRSSRRLSRKLGTQQVPAKGSHLIRYYRWYSNKSRGIRQQAEASSEDTASAATATRRSTRCRQTWAMLIQRVYEVAPLSGPHWGGEMKVVTFLEPPQAEVIEKILRDCGLWQSSTPRAPPDVAGGWIARWTTSFRHRRWSLLVIPS